MGAPTVAASRHMAICAGLCGLGGALMLLEGGLHKLWPRAGPRKEELMAMPTGVGTGKLRIPAECVWGLFEGLLAEA